MKLAALILAAIVVLLADPVAHGVAVCKVEKVEQCPEFLK